MWPARRRRDLSRQKNNDSFPPVGEGTSPASRRGRDVSREEKKRSVLRGEEGISSRQYNRPSVPPKKEPIPHASNWKILSSCQWKKKSVPPVDEIWSARRRRGNLFRQKRKVIPPGSRSKKYLPARRICSFRLYEFFPPGEEEEEISPDSGNEIHPAWRR